MEELATQTAATLRAAGLNSDDVMAVPFGAGLMYSYDMFMLDARFTYRETFFNDMFRATGEKLNTWGVGGNIGVEF